MVKRGRILASIDDIFENEKRAKQDYLSSSPQQSAVDLVGNIQTSLRHTLPKSYLLNHLQQRPTCQASSVPKEDISYMESQLDEITIKEEPLWEDHTWVDFGIRRNAEVVDLTNDDKMVVPGIERVQHLYHEEMANSRDIPTDTTNQIGLKSPVQTIPEVTTRELDNPAKNQGLLNFQDGKLHPREYRVRESSDNFRQRSTATDRPSQAWLKGDPLADRVSGDLNELSDNALNNFLMQLSNVTEDDDHSTPMSPKPTPSSNMPPGGPYSSTQKTDASLAQTEKVISRLDDLHEEDRRAVKEAYRSSKLQLPKQSVLTAPTSKSMLETQPHTTMWMELPGSFALKQQRCEETDLSEQRCRDIDHRVQISSDFGILEKKCTEEMSGHTRHEVKHISEALKSEGSNPETSSSAQASPQDQDIREIRSRHSAAKPSPSPQKVVNASIGIKSTANSMYGDATKKGKSLAAAILRSQEEQKKEKVMQREKTAKEVFPSIEEDVVMQNKSASMDLTASDDSPNPVALGQQRVTNHLNQFRDAKILSNPEVVAAIATTTPIADRYGHSNFHSSPDIIASQEHTSSSPYTSSPDHNLPTSPQMKPLRNPLAIVESNPDALKAAAVSKLLKGTIECFPSPTKSVTAAVDDLIITEEQPRAADSLSPSTIPETCAMDVQLLHPNDYVFPDNKGLSGREVDNVQSEDYTVNVQESEAKSDVDRRHGSPVELDVAESLLVESFSATKGQRKRTALVSLEDGQDIYASNKKVRYDASFAQKKGSTVPRDRSDRLMPTNSAQNASPETFTSAQKPRRRLTSAERRENKRLSRIKYANKKKAEKEEMECFVLQNGRNSWDDSQSTPTTRDGSPTVSTFASDNRGPNWTSQPLGFAAFRQPSQPVHNVSAKSDSSNNTMTRKERDRTRENARRREKRRLERERRENATMQAIQRNSQGMTFDDRADKSDLQTLQIGGATTVSIMLQQVARQAKSKVVKLTRAQQEEARIAELKARLKQYQKPEAERVGTSFGSGTTDAQEATGDEDRVLLDDYHSDVTSDEDETEEQTNRRRELRQRAAQPIAQPEKNPTAVPCSSPRPMTSRKQPVGHNCDQGKSQDSDAGERPIFAEPDQDEAQLCLPSHHHPIAGKRLPDYREQLELAASEEDLSGRDSFFYHADQNAEQTDDGDQARGEEPGEDMLFQYYVTRTELHLDETDKDPIQSVSPSFYRKEEANEYAIRNLLNLHEGRQASNEGQIMMQWNPSGLNECYFTSGQITVQCIVSRRIVHNAPLPQYAARVPVATFVVHQKKVTMQRNGNRDSTQEILGIYGFLDKANRDAGAEWLRLEIRRLRLEGGNREVLEAELRSDMKTCLDDLEDRSACFGRQWQEGEESLEIWVEEKIVKGPRN